MTRHSVHVVTMIHSKSTRNSGIIMQSVLLLLLLCLFHVSTALESRRARMGIVTGGTRGIGRGISERLASWLDVLILTYHTDVERAQQVAQELQDRYEGLHVELVAGDLSECATRDAILSVWIDCWRTTKRALVICKSWYTMRDNMWVLRQKIVPI